MLANKQVTNDSAASAGAEAAGEPGGKKFRMREIICVAAAILAVSGILWWRFLPLPHQDLSFYTEPAYLLATTGKLAGPGSQAVDLTYQKGSYSYPPGYFLILAGWLRIFGLSADSLLAYTHLVHAVALIMLWMLLRFRYFCSKIVSALVLLAFFPQMVHGRPDLTAAALSIAAWLALPEKIAWGRIAFSGCLAGAALLVSPGFGVAIISTLVILMLLDAQRTFPLRLGGAVAWLAAAGTFFCFVVAAILTQQDSWMIAYVQFKTNVMIRGAQVNVLPSLHVMFTWAFAIVPFVLIAVLPAALAASGIWKDCPKELRRVGIAFLGSAAVWFVLNKSQLLMEHHLLYPTKSVFVGLFYSWPKLPRWLRVAPLLLLCTISFYFHKPDFLYVGTPLRAEERSYASGVHLAGNVAVDSLYFPRFDQPGRTLNYEVVAYENYWPRYRAAIPAFARYRMLAGLADQPAEPDMLLISAYTDSRLLGPQPAGLECEQPSAFGKRLHVLGRTWNLPAQPYALKVCRQHVSQHATL